MGRSITYDGPRAPQRAGVTGAHVEPIASTLSFEAPRAGARRRQAPANVAPVPAAEAPTRRGGPRPITQTSIKAITGDYAKADDNETANRPTARRITERLPSFESERATETEPPARRSSSLEAPVPKPTSERRIWLQGALTGALILTLAWLASLIARGG